MARLIEVFLIGIFALMAMFYLTDSLTQERFYALLIAAAIIIFIARSESVDINFWEAREISRNTIKKLQNIGDAPNGEIDVMMEERLIEEIVYEDHTDSRGNHRKEPVITTKGWAIGATIEGNPKRAYEVEVSRKGVVLGVTEIDNVSSYRLKRTEPKKRRAVRSQSNVKQGDENEDLE